MLQSNEWIIGEVSLLREVWHSDMKAEEIAHLISETFRTKRNKNAVIGKAKRLKLGYKSKRYTDKPNAIKEPVKKPVKKHVKKAIKKDIKKDIKEEVKPVLHFSIDYNKPHNHMINITPDRCVWVIGEPKNGICCSQPTVDGTYCKEHRRKSYRRVG